jgi:hypothetical protein
MGAGDQVKHVDSYEVGAESVDDVEALGSFGNFGFAMVERVGSCSGTSIDCNGASQANMQVTSECD